MIVAITGGRDRTPTLAELDELDRVLFGSAALESYRKRKGEQDQPGIGATVVRHGDARGTDRAVAAYLRARGRCAVEAWPADWKQWGTAAGPRRNREMLDGLHGDVDLRPPVQRLISFDGGVGTADCRKAASERGILVTCIHSVDEPRPWNSYHGKPTRRVNGADEPAPELYCGWGSPVGNPWRADARGLRGEARAEAAEEVLVKYRKWLWAQIDKRSPSYDPAVVAHIRSLTPEHYAVCSCWPAHCHVEIVIAAWRWLARE